MVGKRERKKARVEGKDGGEWIKGREKGVKRLCERERDERERKWWWRERER